MWSPLYIAPRIVQYVIRIVLAYFSREEKRGKTRSSMVPSVSPLHRCVTWLTSTIDGVYKCTHTHTHNHTYPLSHSPPRVHTQKFKCTHKHKTVKWKNGCCKCNLSLIIFASNIMCYCSHLCDCAFVCAFVNSVEGECLGGRLVGVRVHVYMHVSYPTIWSTAPPQKKKKIQHRYYIHVGQFLMKHTGCVWEFIIHPPPPQKKKKKKKKMYCFVFWEGFFFFFFPLLFLNHKLRRFVRKMVSRV